MINDPDAPSTDAPQGEPNSVAGVLSGNAAPRGEPRGVVSADLINNTLAGIPGGAEAFWEGMQGSGFAREELLQMLASEMYVPWDAI